MSRAVPALLLSMIVAAPGIAHAESSVYCRQPTTWPVDGEIAANTPGIRIELLAPGSIVRFRAVRGREVPLESIVGSLGTTFVKFGTALVEGEQYELEVLQCGMASFTFAFTAGPVSPLPTALGTLGAGQLQRALDTVQLPVSLTPTAEFEAWSRLYELRYMEVGGDGQAPASWTDPLSTSFVVDCPGYPWAFGSSLEPGAKRLRAEAISPFDGTTLSTEVEVDIACPEAPTRGDASTRDLDAGAGSPIQPGIDASASRDAGVRGDAPRPSSGGCSVGRSHAADPWWALALGAALLERSRRASRRARRERV
jgi:hypothetical protein